MASAGLLLSRQGTMRATGGLRRQVPGRRSRPPLYGRLITTRECKNAKAVLFVIFVGGKPHHRPSVIAAIGQQLAAAHDEAHLLLSTPSGRVDIGLMVYNMLRALPIKVITYNVGTVNSIGNLVFLAGAERYAAPTSSLEDAAPALRADRRLDNLTSRGNGRIGRKIADRWDSRDSRPLISKRWGRPIRHTGRALHLTLSWRTTPRRQQPRRRAQLAERKLAT
jgi:hypothetical protein